MIHRMFAFVLVGASFSISAMASSPTLATAGEQRPDRDDAVLRCSFAGLEKGEDNCRAFGKFDFRAFNGKNWVLGDRDDRLKVVCGDNDNDADDVVIYNDGIQFRLARDADDTRRITDVDFAGVNADKVPLIHVEDWDRGASRAVMTASIIFRRADHLESRTGSCEIARKNHHPVLVGEPIITTDK